MQPCPPPEVPSTFLSAQTTESETCHAYTIPGVGRRPGIHTQRQPSVHHRNPWPISWPVRWPPEHKTCTDSPSPSRLALRPNHHNLSGVMRVRCYVAPAPLIIRSTMKGNAAAPPSYPERPQTRPRFERIQPYGRRSLLGKHTARKCTPNFPLAAPIAPLSPRIQR